MNIIMHDALHYFEKNGYDNTTVEQLCQEAMISQSTFFNYFGTKEKLVELIMEDGLNDYLEYSEKAMKEASDPFDGIEAALGFQADATEKYANIVSVFHRLALQRDEFRILENKFNKHSAEMIIQAFQKNGRECPLSPETLEHILGGFFAMPFMIYEPEEACHHIRQTSKELIKLIKEYK